MNEILGIAYFPGDKGTIVYWFFILPRISRELVFIFSNFSGSYTSKDEGKLIEGKWNKLKFPVPLISKFNWNASESNNSCFDVLTTKSNFPTAPEKLLGFPCSGNGFTLIFKFPAETVLLTVLATLLWKTLG